MKRIQMLQLLQVLILPFASRVESREFRSFYGHRKPCSATPSTLPSRGLIRHELAVDEMSCLLQCTQADGCVQCVATPDHQTAFHNCSLLELDTLQDYVVQQGSGCMVLDVLVGSNRTSSNECRNGGVYNDSVCTCPKGFTGMHCQVERTAECWTPRRLVHSVTRNQAGHVDTHLDGTQEFPDIDSSDIKVTVRLEGQTHYGIGPATFQLLSLKQMAQVHNTLSRDSLGVDYEETPTLNSYAVTTDGKISIIKAYGNGSYTEQASFGAVSFHHRDGRIAMNVTDDPSETASRISALLVGKHASSVTEFHTLVNTSADNFLMKADMNFIQRPLDESTTIPLVFTTSCGESQSDAGFAYSHKYQDNRKMTRPQTFQHTWVFDTCWYPASHDVNSPALTPSADPDLDPVDVAIVQGKPARVVYNSMYGQVKGYVRGHNFLLVYLSPYFSPANQNILEQTSRQVWTLVTTDGQLKTCEHFFRDSTSLHRADQRLPASQVQWYVHSGVWVKAYVTRMDGSHVDGNLQDLVDKVTGGADVHVSMNFPTSGLQVSYLAHWIDVDQQMDILSAESSFLLSVDVQSSTIVLPDQVNCELTKWLTSTAVGAKKYLFTYGAGGVSRYMDLSAEEGTVTWYTRL